MKKIFIIAIFLFFGAQSVYGATANYVNTSNPTNITANGAKFSGITATSSALGDTVVLYFQYGTSSSQLASSTSLFDLSDAEDTTSNDLKKVNMNVADLQSNSRIYVRMVRRVTPETGTAQLYYGNIVSFLTPVLNLPPYVQSLTTRNINYVSSDCEVTTSCTVEIPENLPSYTTILNIKKADPNNDSVTLSLKSGNTDGAFRITSSGNLVVNQKSALDFETNPEFNLVIELKDSGAGRLTSTYALKIKLKNIVDESAPLPPSYISTNNSQAPSYTHTSDRNVNYVSNNQSNVGKYTYRPNINTTEYRSQGSVGVEPYRNPNSGGQNINLAYTSNNNTNVNSSSNLTNTQRQALIQNLLAQLAVLQAELDRRIRLGIE